MSSKLKSGVHYAYMHGGAAWRMLTVKGGYGVIQAIQIDVTFTSVCVMSICECVKSFHVCPVLSTTGHLIS